MLQLPVLAEPASVAPVPTPAKEHVELPFHAEATAEHPAPAPQQPTMLLHQCSPYQLTLWLLVPGRESLSPITPLAWPQQLFYLLLLPLPSPVDLSRLQNI